MAIYFTPGPSQPYPKLRAFLDDAWAADVMAVSHRGGKFTDIYRRTDAAVRELLGVPEDYVVMFVGSATEAMERVVQGLVEQRSHHFVNGAFSEKWYEMAGQLGRSPSVTRVEAGRGFAADDLASVPGDAELVCLTHNETSTGAALGEGVLEAAGALPGRPLVAVDVVSSAPVVELPWPGVDVALFSVQKAFGLPAGLGVLIAGPRAVARAEALAARGASVGSYHSLSRLAKQARKLQTPATPNVLGIYLLGRVAEDMLAGGIGEMRRETRRRAAAWYEAVEAHGAMRPFVANPSWRSQTVVVAELVDGSEGLHGHLLRSGFVVSRGYGEFRDRHVRIANFPALSRGAVDELISHVRAYDYPPRTLADR